VVVVARLDDTATHDLIAKMAWEKVVVADVAVPGMIAAMQRGTAATTGEVVAFTDDDAVPHADWIERLVAAFTDPKVGAVGGRDVQPDEGESVTCDVGRLTPYGRLVGNQHRGIGRARVVDCLKGVNMAFRSDALAFAKPGLLRGAGAQPHNEPIMCRWVQKQGLRVVYDPAIAVDHFPAVRMSGDTRGAADRRLVVDAAHNLVVSICALDRRRIPVQALYSVLLGGLANPGIVRALVGLARGERATVTRFLPALEGSAHAVGTLARLGSSTPVVTCEQLRTAAQPS
jgi:hypothetical protein